MRNTITKLWGVIQNLAYHLRHRNFDALGQWLSETLRTCLCHRIEYIVFTRSLEGPLPSFEARLPITYRVAEPDDLSYLRDVILPSELEYFSKRLAHGRICILALYQENLIAYAWASDEVNLEIDNLELRLEPGDVYLDDFYTLPAYRRQGVYSALHLQELRYVQERGFKRAVAIVAVDNIPPQKLMKKIGYQEADRLSFRRILFKRDYHYHNGQF
jgi:ribosomal protein S18 acetylase RimI-like enzyme